MGSLYESTAFISLQAIKLIKEFSALPEEEFTKLSDKLLINSNNQELLSYIFRRNIPNLAKEVMVIKTLSDKGPQTPERQFLAYGWSLYLLYEFASKGQKPQLYGIEKQLADNELTADQLQALMDVTAKQFAQITSAKEGIKYLRLIGAFTYDPSKWVGPTFTLRWKEAIDNWKKFADSPLPIASKLFDKASGLKDNLKKITDSLSQRFKDDPDYPEWAKWVNKIFPQDMPQNQK
jgi:hypothetical protein